MLQSYRLGLDNLEQSIILAKSSYYPTLALAGRYERNGNDFGAATNNFANEDNASIIVTAKWDFFEWGRTGAEVAKQKFARQALAEKMQGVENQLRLDIQKAFLDLQVAENNIGTAGPGTRTGQRELADHRAAVPESGGDLDRGPRFQEPAQPGGKQLLPGPLRLPDRPGAAGAGRRQEMNAANSIVSLRIRPLPSADDSW